MFDVAMQMAPPSMSIIKRKHGILLVCLTLGDTGRETEGNIGGCKWSENSEGARDNVRGIERKITQMLQKGNCSGWVRKEI